jgi:hypothetical protein
MEEPNVEEELEEMATTGGFSRVGEDMSEHNEVT